MKNIVFWIGVIPDDPWVTERYKYGDFSWMEYSKRTWEYWCEKNDVEFVHYHTPSRSDYKQYKINWQRWFDVFDYIPDDYDSVLLVDASIMVKWDAPNYFDTGDGEWCALRADENWGWTHKSARGYRDMFPDVDFNHNDYFSSGFTLFRKKHEPIIKKMTEFFMLNHDEIIRREDVTVKRGRDQPVLNYLVQEAGIPVHFWDKTMGVSHLYRRELLAGNWQLDDPTPFFIRYFNAWIFSGFPDRGDTRTKLMSQTWDIVKSHYQ